MMSSRNSNPNSAAHDPRPSTLSRLILSAGLISVLPAAGWAAEAQPLSLRECYALALRRSETIAIQQELIKETEGRFLQSLSGILPRASFSSSDKRQSGSGGSAFTLRDVPERKFVFSQPLFSGFKEFAAMAGSRAERRERIQEKVRAEQLLLVDVADAFHLLLQQREDLQALETIRLTLTERIDELNARKQLGRSRASEVVSAEAQLRRIEAEMELIRSQETTARQLLEFLTGLPRIEAIADDAAELSPLADASTYLQHGETRPDVKAAEEAWRKANEEVRIAQAKVWPSVGLEGNYYVERVGVAKDVDWDATLKVDVPLFQGGQNVGAIKEASSRARQAELRFEQTKRQAGLDISDAYALLQAAIARLAALRSALDASEENYRLQVEDYQVNLVSNLDVLQVLRELLDARREVIGATHEAKRRYWQLQAAIGATL